jgi:hypothetical protein
MNRASPKVVIFVRVCVCLLLLSSSSAAPSGRLLTLPGFKGSIGAATTWPDILSILPDSAKADTFSYWTHKQPNDTLFHVVEIPQPNSLMPNISCNIEFTHLQNRLLSATYFSDGNWNCEDGWLWFREQVKHLPVDQTRNFKGIETDSTGSLDVERWTCPDSRWSIFQATQEDVDLTGDTFMLLRIEFIP